MVESPSELDGARVILYTENDGRGSYGLVYYEDEDREEDITALAIWKYPNDQEVYLFACNRFWNVIGDTLHDSIDAAKEFAEDYYEANDIQWRKKDNDML